MKVKFICTMINATTKKPIVFETETKLKEMIDFCIKNKWDFKVVF